MAQLTYHDDVKKKVSEILKRVDQLIKTGEIDRSVREIIDAKDIDPTNAYIHAYEERLAYLKEEHEKHIEGERTRKEAEEAARKRDQELRRQQEEERKREEERKKAAEEHSGKEAVRQPEPKSQLNGARDVTTINTFNKIPSDNRITRHQPTKLQEEIRNQSENSSERRLQMQARLLPDVRKNVPSESILLIDDDEQMRQMLLQTLSYHGYNVTSLATSEEAYTLLKKWKPELILCDINLETSAMGGFSFYEKIRQLEHLHNVPFIFLSGLTDEVIIRAGKEIGVDDYLTKPITEQNLLAAVRGKLKRFSKPKEKSS